MEVKQGYKQTEVGVIPEDWDCAVIRNAVASKPNAIVGGPFGSDLVSADYVVQGIPVVRGKNMSGSTVSGEFVFVSERKAKSLTANLACAKDLIFTQRGTLGQVAIVPDGEYQCYLVSQSQMKASFNEARHNPQFVRHYFSSSEGQRQIADSAIQTGVPHTNLEILRSYQFPAPPILEQHIIATALSDMDALLDGLDRLIAKKRAIKQATMQQLLTGQTRLPGFSGEWEVKRLGDCVSIRNQKVLPVNVAPEMLCVELEHVGQGDGRLLVRGEARNSSAAKYRFQAGDVLFGRLRSYLRKYWLASEDGICTTEIWPLSFDVEKVSSGFLFSLVQTDAFIEAASISYGTHMPRADWGVIRNHDIHLPSIEEQAAIAAILSEIDSEITALETRRTKTRALKQAMMQELLTGRTRLV